MAWQVIRGDLQAVLPYVPDCSIDACVCDPPYELGFMGKRWDSSGIAFQAETWAHVLRVLKPGGHLLAFSGTRTYHRMACAIEDAGFEIRDQLAWMYGTGFPKSKNIAMSIDKGEGVIGHRSVRFVTAGGDLPPPDRDVGAYVPEGATPGAPWAGWGTALKPAQEPIVLARKPLIGTVAANVLEYGTGGLAIDACRIGTDGGGTHCTNRDEHGKCRGHQNAGQSTSGETFHGPDTSGGRWPANVLLDEEAAAMLDAQSGITKDGVAVKRNGVRNDNPIAFTSALPPGTPDQGYGGSGGASRFFYVAKASKAEREAGLDHLPVRTGGELTDRVDGSLGLDSPRAGAGRKGGRRRNHHPTVKPVALCRYLLRLVTPPGGLVLDPFMGSGSMGVAAVLEGFNYLGIDLDSDENGNPLGYVELAEARIRHAETHQRAG